MHGSPIAPVRRRRTRAGALVVLLASAVALLPACGSGSDTGAGSSSTTPRAVSPELRNVMDAAKGEGKLLLSWRGVLGDIDGAPALVKGFKKYYDLGLDVVFTPGSGQGDMSAKVEQEGKAGLPASTDVISLNASAVRQLAGRDVIAKVDWSSFAPNIGKPGMVAADGAAVAVQDWVMGIAYDTDRVSPKEAPTSMEQLLEPAYKGRIYTTPFGGGFDLLASDDGWGRERTIDFTKKFAKQVGGLGFNVQPLLSGEFDIMALLVPPGSALKAKADGAPIEFVIPTDAALLYQNLVAIPANSKHPNAARLFVDYLMSPEGQAVLRKTDFADSPLVPGSYTGAQIKAAEAKGATFINGDVPFYARQDPEQYKRNAADLVQILLTRGG
jgi:ABC-type Fe3+ transport system substrate-binding protein